MADGPGIVVTRDTDEDVDFTDFPKPCLRLRGKQGGGRGHDCDSPRYTQKAGTTDRKTIRKTMSRPLTSIVRSIRMIKTRRCRPTAAAPCSPMHDRFWSRPWDIIYASAI